MKFTSYGHAAFSINTGDYRLLFDPFISGNELASSINIEEIQADYILLSHGHGDHVMDAEAIAKRTNAPIISNFEIVEWYGKKGLKGHPLNHGGKWKFKFGTVNYVNAIHSSVLPDGTYGGNPGGFILELDGKTIYYSGDTALTMDMKLIPVLYPKLDLAILPIGDNFTMGYEHAAIAANFVECNKVIGCHFDTFGFVKIDHDKAREAFQKKGVSLILPEIGQEIDI